MKVAILDAARTIAVRRPDVDHGIEFDPFTTARHIIKRRRAGFAEPIGEQRGAAPEASWVAPLACAATMTLNVACVAARRTAAVVADVHILLAR